MRTRRSWEIQTPIYLTKRLYLFVSFHFPGFWGGEKKGKGVGGFVGDMPRKCIELLLYFVPLVRVFFNGHVIDFSDLLEGCGLVPPWSSTYRVMRLFYLFLLIFSHAIKMNTSKN